MLKFATRQETVEHVSRILAEGDLTLEGRDPAEVYDVDGIAEHFWEWDIDENAYVEVDGESFWEYIFENYADE